MQRGRASLGGEEAWMTGLHVDSRLGGVPRKPAQPSLDGSSGDGRWFPLKRCKEERME